MTTDKKITSVYLSAQLRKDALDAGINLSATCENALRASVNRMKSKTNTKQEGREEA